MTIGSYCAVYDFELMPYALGDVLTWNVQSAIRCEDAGCERVDVLICMDDRYPSSIYQRNLVNAENCGLFFSELFGAFGTHPKLGNLFLYRRREEVLERLAEASRGNAANGEVLADYERALANRGDEKALIEYFTKYIHSHERINEFAAQHGHIPLLRPSMGCEPDVAGLVETRLAGKRIVPIHMRLRRLDAGFGGEHTYSRDSDFLEWYEFLKEAGDKHPDVQFVALGRLQEKPIELLRLPNVISLRTLGLGLGHELTLMLRSDLFLGSSSGFAAMANFSAIPYFITKMNAASCAAYRIEYGVDRLPFASERQVLVYQTETRELLLRLLERGLQEGGSHRQPPGVALDGKIDVRSWEWERSQWQHPGASTYRFFTDDTFCHKETAFLVLPNLKEAQAAWRKGDKDLAWNILQRVESHFPGMCAKFPELLRLKHAVAIGRNESEAIRACEADLKRLAIDDESRAGLVDSIKRYIHWCFPFAMRLKGLWQRKHRVPRKLMEAMRRLAVGQAGR